MMKLFNLLEIKKWNPEKEKIHSLLVLLNVTLVEICFKVILECLENCFKVI